MAVNQHYKHLGPDDPLCRCKQQQQQQFLQKSGESAWPRLFLRRVPQRTSSILSKKQASTRCSVLSTYLMS